MDIIKDFAFDKEAAEQGKWFKLGPNERIKMRSMACAHSRAVRVKLEAPYSVILDAGEELPADIAEQMLRDQFVESLILDWEGLTNDGDPFPYSKANAHRMMNEAKGFTDLLVKILMGKKSFQPIVAEEGEKN